MCQQLSLSWLQRLRAVPRHPGTALACLTSLDKGTEAWLHITPLSLKFAALRADFLMQLVCTVLQCDVAMLTLHDSSQVGQLLLPLPPWQSDLAVL